MTDQELKLELLKVAKAQSPHEMSGSPLENAEMYYQWVKGNVTFEEENMTPPGYNEQVERLKDLADKLSKERINLPGDFKGNVMILEKDWDIIKQVQSIIKTAQSEIQESILRYHPDGIMERSVKIYKNAFNKLLEL